LIIFMAALYSDTKERRLTTNEMVVQLRLYLPSEGQFIF